MKYYLSFSLILLIISCASYIDVPKNNFNDNNIKFEFARDVNNFKYTNNVNASADKNIYYATHFSINLPKGIVNWTRNSNNFFFEYKDKQIFYVYSSFKNEGQESLNWRLNDVDYNEVLRYIGEYWDNRKYNENFLYKSYKGRVSKLYTNGKYKILLYNIKTENIETFIQNAKTFNTDLL